VLYILYYIIYINNKIINNVLLLVNSSNRILRVSMILPWKGSQAITPA